MKYYIMTLGCPKNTVDSEGMAGILAGQGHQAVGQAAEADVVIVNTCSFIAAARDETLGVLRDLADQKAPGQRLIAAGCMAESHGALLQERVPGLDATLSTREWMRIGEVVGGAAARDDLQIALAPAGPASATLDLIPLAPAQPPTRATSLEIPLVAQPAPAATPQGLIPLLPAGAPETLGAYGDWRTEPIRRQARGPSAYLKISDGCNLRCAFCTIPSFKGDMRSKAMGAILGEARQLVESGVQEIILVAQHLTDYGRDLGLKDNGLATLLEELCGVVPEDRWIRLMYAYPQSVTPRLIEVMASHKQICHYLDMPLQHAHPATLRRMRRPPDTDRTRRLIADLRAAMPDIAIRTTFIVGFPGETREEFQALLDFLRETELDRAGFFRYSLEPDTAAGELPGQVAERIKERRWQEAMELQRTIAAARNRRWAGQRLRVLVEGNGADERGQPISAGRTYRDAPEIDGMVFIRGTAQPGTFVEVQVERALEYDLWGSVGDRR